MSTWRLLFLGSLALSSACTSSGTGKITINLGEGSKGEEGVLDFTYTGLACLFGCKLDKPVLVGSQVSISARGGDPNVRRTARLAGQGIGAITKQSESCSCSKESGNSTTTKSLPDPNAACPPDETKKCSALVTIDVKTVGEDKLEVLEGASVVDRITVRARAATRFAPRVTVSGDEIQPQGGVYEIKKNTSATIDPKPFDGESELQNGSKGVVFKAADPTILVAGSVSFDATTQAFSGAKEGETTVTLTAANAETTVPFRVIP